MIPLAKAVLVAALLAAAAPAQGAGKGLSPGERIDLNRATVSELMRLPGVGERRAQAIVAHRSRQPFRRAEDVLAVKGLGAAWFAKVKANVTVGAAPAAPAAPAASAKK